MSPLFQIGKNGISEEMVGEFAEALEKRELMKVQLLQNTVADTDEVTDFIEEHSDINVVQKIGKVLVLYRPSSKEKYQNYSEKLPKSNKTE